MTSFTTTNRRTLFGSVVVTVAVVAAAFAAPAAGQTDRSSELQQLVSDLDYQLNLVQQFDRLAAEKRRGQLARAIKLWNASPRTEADFELMQQWLQDAIRASMPGLSQGAPRLPLFTKPAPKPLQTPQSAAEPALAEKSAEAIPPTRPIAKAPPAKLNRPTAKLLPKEKNHKRRVIKAPGMTNDTPAHASQPKLGNPFIDDPISEVFPTIAQPSSALKQSTTDTPASRSSRVVMRPAGLSSPVGQGTQVKVNVAELGARVRGYVHGLRGVEARLVAAPDMPAEELLLLSRELLQLASQREFLSLYLDGIAAGDSILPAELPPLDTAKAMVEARVDELSQPAGGADSDVSVQLFDEVFANPDQDASSAAVETIRNVLAEI